MKKITVFLFIFISLFFVKTTHAQENVGGEPVPAVRFVCLDMTWCENLDPEACGFIEGQHQGHRALLQSTSDAPRPVANQPTYITECLDIDANFDGVPESVCTTGSSELDRELFCGSADATGANCDHLTYLQNVQIGNCGDLDGDGEEDESCTTGYSLDREQHYGIFHFINNAFVRMQPQVISSNINGIVPAKIAWSSYTHANLTRRFLAWNTIETTERVTGGVGGQQLSTVDFTTQSSTCSGQAWDPYGRVFDAVTLEPVPASQVTLKRLNPSTNVFEAGYASQTNPTILNPNVTLGDGKFNFLVVDGDYQLAPMRSNYTQLALSEANTLKPNTNKIYSNIYYSDSPAIKQVQGNQEQRDIPMKPDITTGYRYPLTISTQNESVNSNGEIVYTGTVSHPFAELVVEICKRENGIEVCNGKTIYRQTNGGPDKNGDFQVTLIQRNLEAGEYFKKTFTPVDLNAITIVDNSILNRFMGWLSSVIKIPEVQAQDRSVSTVTQPILAYLEGFAYDSEGNLMSNATVGIYVPFSEQPLYTVKTNASGYFKITSEYLPTTAYAIRYTGTGGAASVAQLTTSDFLTQNEEFITVEKVNPYLFATQLTDPRRDVTPTYKPPQKISVSTDNQISQAPSNVSPTQAAVAAAGPQQILLVGVVLLLLMGTAGLLLVMYLYKKRTQNTPLS